MRHLGDFARSENGAAAVVLGLSLLPMMVATGAAIDYSRAASIRSAMQRAVDSAAIAVARDSSGLSDAGAEKRGRQFFAANFQNSEALVAPVKVTRDNKTVRIAASGTVPSAFMQVVGVKSMPIASEAVVGWGTRKIELALVLDNTGSMNEALGGGLKIDELKKAALGIIDKAEKSSPKTGEFKMAIVPFDTQVNVGTQLSPLAVDFGFGITQAAWQGCIMDRGETGNYDVNDLPAELAVKGSQFPAVPCTTGNLAQLRPLTETFSDLRGTVNAMKPSGCTNITIGTTWGLKTLSPGAPLIGGAPYGTPDVDKYMVVVTDGDNTRNRSVKTTGCGGSASSATIDDRTRVACQAAKVAGIRVYTVLVGKGNAKLLGECAGNGGTFVLVTDAAQISSTFQKIFDDILSIRLTR